MNESPPIYRSTQTAGSGLVTVALLALLGIVAASVTSPGEPLLFTMGLAVALAMLMLHSVSVVVDDEALAVRLGIGWIRWRIAREDIVSVDTVRLPGGGGLPLRRHEGAWVVGFDTEEAVRVALAHTTLYVATHETIELALALRPRSAETS